MGYQKVLSPSKKGITNLLYLSDSKVLQYFHDIWYNSTASNTSN